MKSNFSLLDGCTFRYTREEDPCLAYWLDVSRMSIYSFGVLAAITAKSRPEYDEPDMLTYIAPVYFPGFARG
jgi:choline dehydrogenase